MKVFQQRSSGGVCISCICFCCGITSFFIKKENNIFYFKIRAIFNHFGFFLILRLKVWTKFIKERAMFKETQFVPEINSCLFTDLCYVLCCNFDCFTFHALIDSNANEKQQKDHILPEKR